MSAVMFLGISAKIKRLFVLDSKDFVEVLGGIFRIEFGIKGFVAVNCL